MHLPRRDSFSTAAKARILQFSMLANYSVPKGSLYSNRTRVNLSAVVLSICAILVCANSRRTLACQLPVEGVEGLGV